MFASVVSAIAGQRLVREERLVAGDQDVGEGEQALEDVVLDDLVGEVLEEQVGLLLVDVDGEVADPAGLQPLDRRPRRRPGRRGWC